MTDFLISYQGPLEYASVTEDDTGAIEHALMLLGGSIIKSSAGPSLTIVCRTPDSVTIEDVRLAVQQALSPHNGRACVAEVAPCTRAWSWPTKQSARNSSNWQSLGG